MLHRAGNLSPVMLILGLAVVLRAGLPVAAALASGDTRVFHALDTGSYVRPAIELASHGRFAVDGASEILRTPGYPLLLIPGVLSGRLELVTIVLQILLSSLTVYLIFKIGLLMFGRRGVALTGALLYAIEPISILYTSKILSETLFTALIATSLYFLVNYVRASSTRHLVGMSLALSAAIYVRPIAYFLPVVVAVLIVVRGLRHGSKTWFPQVALFLILVALPVGLWHVRNKIESGYRGFAAVTADNLYFYQAAAVLAAREGTSYYEMQNRLGFRDIEVYFRNHPEQRDWQPARRFEYMQRDGLRTVVSNLSIYWKIHVKGALLTLLEPGAVEYLKLLKLYPESGGLLGVLVDRGLFQTVLGLVRGQPLIFWSTLAFGLFLGIVVLLAGVSLVSSAFWKNEAAVATLVIAAYFLILSGGPMGQSRFRHPMMPALCLLAGHGACLTLDCLRAKFGRFG